MSTKPIQCHGCGIPIMANQGTCNQCRMSVPARRECRATINVTIWYVLGAFLIGLLLGVLL